MIISCDTAHSHCKAILGEKVKEAKKLVENERRELFQRVLSGLIEIQDNLIVSTCDSLDDEFTRYAAEAGKQADRILVVKANALKRRQTELETKVKDLQDQIEAKRLKLSYIEADYF